MQVADLWSQRGHKTKRLQVSHAFHSPLMDDMLEAFGEVLTDMSFAEPSIPVISNLTAEPLSSEQVRDPRYWVDHVRGTVQFADGVRWLAERGVDSFLELGPDGVLSAMCAECLADPAASEPDLVAAVPALREGRAEVGNLLGALARLWVRGAELDWAAMFGEGPRRVDLPTYAFQRDRYWFDPLLHGENDPEPSNGVRASSLPETGASALLALRWTPSIAGSLRNVGPHRPVWACSQRRSAIDRGLPWSRSTRQAVRCTPISKLWKLLWISSRPFPRPSSSIVWRRPRTSICRARPTRARPVRLSRFRPGSARSDSPSVCSCLSPVALWQPGRRIAWRGSQALRYGAWFAQPKRRTPGVSRSSTWMASAHRGVCSLPLSQWPPMSLSWRCVKGWCWRPDLRRCRRLA